MLELDEDVCSSPKKYLFHFAMECNSRYAGQNLQLREHSAPVINTRTCHEVSVHHRIGRKLIK